MLIADVLLPYARITTYTSYWLHRWAQGGYGWIYPPNGRRRRPPTKEKFTPHHLWSPKGTTPQKIDLDGHQNGHEVPKWNRWFPKKTTPKMSTKCPKGAENFSACGGLNFVPIGNSLQINYTHHSPF